MDKDNEALLLVAELWKRRLEWMWKNWNAEYAPSKELDVAYIDSRIIEDESK
jgi:hypothetical protein